MGGGGGGEIQKYLFLRSNKVQFVPSWCAVFFLPPPSLLLRGPLSFPALNSLSLPQRLPSPAQLGLPSWSQARELLAVLAGRAGGLSLSPKEQNASLSLCLSVSLCVRVCVSLTPCVSAPCAPPVAAFPPAHPESRSLAVLAPLQDVDVGAGEMALFECLVAGPADVEVDWLCRGRLLQPALLKCKMHFDGRKCKLLLTSVHEDDSGVYTCKLSTAKGNCSLRP